MCRAEILHAYARWTALSALRQGPSTRTATRNVRSKEVVYSLVDTVHFDPVLGPDLDPITCDEFEDWHEEQITGLVDQEEMGQDNIYGPQFGWAAKIINVYLKTACYVGDLGRPNIRQFLHPPVDRGLWRGVRQEFGHLDHTIERTHTVTAIRAINSHERYTTIIDGFRDLAHNEAGCELIEVEQFWDPN